MAVIQDTADALAAVFRAQGLNVPADSWTTGNVTPPAVAIEIPDWEGTDLEGAESQLGTDDWTLQFRCYLLYDLRQPSASQKKLAAALEELVAAIKADPSLGTDFIDDCRITRADRAYNTDQARPLVGYELTVRVLLLV